MTIYWRHTRPTGAIVHTWKISYLSGNLASAIFVPYRPEAGPSGSLAGIVACLFVIFIVDVKDDFRSHWLVAIKWLLFLIFCFVIGLFPGVDNYAIIFGFVMGMLLSALLLPHVGHGKSDDLTEPGDRGRNYRRCVVVVVTLLLSVALLVTLFMLLYMVPIDCKWCGYLDCVPITPDFCAEQQTSFERHRIITWSHHLTKRGIVTQSFCGYVLFCNVISVTFCQYFPKFCIEVSFLLLSVQLYPENLTKFTKKST